MSRKSTWKIKWEKRALKDLDDLPGSDRKRVILKVRQLREDPFLGKPLQGEWKGFRRLRVGDYRVIYALQKEVRIIQIFRIGHRREIYR